MSSLECFQLLSMRNCKILFMGIDLGGMSSHECSNLSSMSGLAILLSCIQLIAMDALQSLQFFSMSCRQAVVVFVKLRGMSRDEGGNLCRMCVVTLLL